MKIKKFQKQILKEMSFWLLFVFVIMVILILILPKSTNLLVILAAFFIMILGVHAIDFFDKDSISNKSSKEANYIKNIIIKLKEKNRHRYEYVKALQDIEQYIDEEMR